MLSQATMVEKHIFEVVTRMKPPITWLTIEQAFKPYYPSLTIEVSIYGLESLQLIYFNDAHEIEVNWERFLG